MKKFKKRSFEVIESGLENVIGGRCVCSPGGWASGRDQGGCACACTNGIDANYNANYDLGGGGNCWVNRAQAY